jgi:DedD protein
MFSSLGSAHEGRGLSPRHLVLIFLAGVAVCGIFFSLGFLVGFNERSSHQSPVTETVVPQGSSIPPTVNAPVETTQIDGGSPGSAITPPPVVKEPPSGAPQEAMVSQKAVAPARASAAVLAPAPAAKASAKPAPAPAVKTQAASSASKKLGDNFAVQVVASRTRQDAEALVKILQGKGYSVILVPPSSGHGSDNLYRVQVGPYATREQADQARAKLTKEGFKPFIRH